MKHHTTTTTGSTTMKASTVSLSTGIPDGIPSSTSSTGTNITSAGIPASSTQLFGTYEATMAALSISQQPDPIHWMNHVTFRAQKYRLLHHQCGTSGIFNVRLLQATNLRRSHWSPLALGPVKLFGLSKAHGPVSSFCEFTLDYVDNRDFVGAAGGGGEAAAATSNDHRKPAARKSGVSSASSNNNNHNNSSRNKPMIVSPIIPNNDHPVWGDTCHFEFPLRKGAAIHDGMRIILTVTVREDATAVEQMIIALPGGGGKNHHTNRILGVGQLDLTELCYGENLMTGQPLPGVRDAWIDLVLPRDNDNEEEEDESDWGKDDNSDNKYNHSTATASATATATAETSNTNNNRDETDRKLPAVVNHSSSSNENDANRSSHHYGQVRVLVSYQPMGLEPQPKDIVAFESFARHHLRTVSCQPVIDPLLPLTVLDRRGPYLLVEYYMTTTTNNTRHEKACLRIHRNAVFVIERQNIVDAATNLALLPIDVALSTPIGQATHRALTPIVMASSELLMPALLSAKLVWMAARTTGLGVTHGLLALTGTLWHEGSTSLTSGGSGGGGNANNSNADSIHQQRRHRQAQQDRRTSATAQFIQL